MAGFLAGVGQLSDGTKSGASHLGATAVSGSLNPNLAPLTPQASDPMSQLASMRQIAAAGPPADRASMVPGSGLVPNSTNYGASTYNPATPTAQPLVGTSGSVANPTDFASQLLGALGYKATQADINSIVNWEGREGGNWNNTAHYNPLNTTQAYDGSTPMNSVGVQAYKNWLDGINATVQTLQNGRYGDILAALQAGNGLVGHIAGLGTWSGGGYYSI